MDIGKDIVRLSNHEFGVSIKAGAGKDILERAVRRYKKLIFTKGEYGALLNPVAKTVFPTPTTSVPTHALAPKGNGGNTKLNLDTDESYTLNVPAKGGQATITAKSVYGALRGLESFSQLVSWTEETDQFRIPLAPVSITDKPVFPHRGVMIDTSRNFLKVADIKRTLDGMSYNKLNVLHWHIIDQHSFPLKTKTYPQLAEKGAYSKQWVYTEKDVRDIVSYAKDRGIRVYPEFDIPGHAYSWGLAFPDIVTCMNMQPNWSDYAAEPNSGQLNIINPKTDEVTTWFDDEFVHIGGDEVNFKCWQDSPGYPEYLQKNNVTLDNLFGQFVLKSHNWVRENKKTPITWQEALTSHHIPIGKDVAVQVWLGAADAIKVVEAGNRVISTSYERWYLDCGRGAWISDSQGNSWCDPYKGWQEQSKLVLGGEVGLWAEAIDGINLDRVLWPRGAAAAEVLWSDIKLADGTIRKTGDVFPRIHEQRARLVDRGIGAEPLQPLWCARNPLMVAIKLLTSISLLAATSMAWVWPLPEKMDIGKNIVRLSNHEFGVSIKACDGKDILERAVRRYKKLIFTKGEYGALLNPVAKTVFPTPTTSVPTHALAPKGKYPLLTHLNIQVSGGNTKLNLDTDESYTLNVPAKGGQATITAKSVYGALRGLESFSQLVSWTEETDQFRIPLAPVSITDKPVFPHRGVMIDTSRNFLKVADIKRTLDGMSYNKLNVLHWHIIDQHSFPLKTKTYPQLAEKGAYSKHWVYTEKDVRDIVSYAKDRGIRVYPEFDIPGHAYSWGLAFPDIVTCMNMQPNWSDYAAEPNSGQLNIINPKTDVIVRNFLKEVTTWFDDEFVHIGGDEVNFKCWEDSPGYPEYLQKNNVTLDNLFGQFVLKSHNWVRENKKTPITWQEALTSHHIPIGKDVAVQVWLGAADAIKVVEAGNRVISTSYERWYLDCGRGAWISDSQGNSWCDPYKGWQVVYNYDLTANMTKEQSKLVLGGEVGLWAEAIDGINLDRVLWPRGAAAAEVLWSDIKLADGTIRKTGDVFPRIHEQRARLVDRGIGAEALATIVVCTQPS
ncbi:hypothetical protein K493DRAFT_406015 [Basidiobolus meristosporus CBS 931.73]|uniref:beta-N-acetylhexosaminidase n=1 Tax=Basidiobolus meristosporus CBS 931.73 TaxID=1314790 RepID=A0A1Y1YQQ4_9FUNG|nr:hypothetical protein K493DRAFT_406015 [Basidiobolus meristosporus CBS 931.73]|eukprot:ORY00077.1 hypothetical protein K493DRAFT_406015 [Basidiobolus meristosporus CBS 931.73]